MRALSVRPELRPHRARPRDRRGARFDAELLVDALQVLVDGTGADFEDRADVAVGLAGREPTQHVLLARREPPVLRRRPASAAERGAKPVEVAEVRADQLERIALLVGEAGPPAPVEAEAHQEPPADGDRHRPG